MERTSSETIWIEVNMKGGITLVGWYHKPLSRYWELEEKIQREITDSCQKNVPMISGFNFPNASCKKGFSLPLVYLTINNSESESVEWDCFSAEGFIWAEFVKCMQESFVKQCVHGLVPTNLPTRILVSLQLKRNPSHLYVTSVPEEIPMVQFAEILQPAPTLQSFGLFMPLGNLIIVSLEPSSKSLTKIGIG